MSKGIWILIGLTILAFAVLYAIGGDELMPPGM